MRSALLCLLLAGPAAAQPPTEVQLEVRGHQRLTLSNVQRLVVGDSTVADVRIRADQVELTGLAEGRTTMTGWKLSGERFQLNITVGHPRGAAPGAPAAVPAPVPGRGHCGPTTGPAADALAAARQLSKDKNDAAAREQYIKALTLDPQLGAARKGLGSVLARLDDLDGAVAQYRAYLEACPDDVDASKVRAILDQREAARAKLLER